MLSCVGYGVSVFRLSVDGRINLSEFDYGESLSMAFHFRSMFRGGVGKSDIRDAAETGDSERDVLERNSSEPDIESDLAASEVSDSVDEPSTGDHGGEGEWLAYELHPWALEDRVMLKQLLTADGVVHSWQGTTLLVHFSLEEKVDDLVDEVEQANSMQIGSEDDLTAFEIGEWPQELRAKLSASLTQARVAYMIDETDDGCDLFVRETDEERAELVIDDLLAREEEADFEDLDGLEVNDLLSALFVACDRLRRNPHDPDGVLGVADSVHRLARVRTPFGFSSTDWRNLRNAAQALLRFLEDDDTGDEDLLIDQACRLRDTLKTII